MIFRFWVNAVIGDFHVLGDEAIDDCHVSSDEVIDESRVSGDKVMKAERPLSLRSSTWTE